MTKGSKENPLTLKEIEARRLEQRRYLIAHLSALFGLEARNAEVLRVELAVDLRGQATLGVTYNNPRLTSHELRFDTGLDREPVLADPPREFDPSRIW